MIGKFAVPGFRIVVGVMFGAILAGSQVVHAQQAPAQPAPQSAPAQPPAAAPASQQPDQSSSQEASPDDLTRRRKAKTHDYKNWTFNVGGGASLTNGTTTKFARGGGAIGAAGVARNANKYLGLRLDFQWDNLPLRTSALEAAQAPGASSHVYTFTLDPIINLPVTRVWGGYVLVGPAFYHRSGKLDSSTAVPGSPCNSFFTWWGSCNGLSLPVDGKFLSTSQNQFGYNFGAGLTRKLTPTIELYGEFRYLHGTHDKLTTDLRPITVGLRW